MPQLPERQQPPLWRSSGWAIAEYAAYPALMIGAMPAYLWALGTLQFGQWMLMLTFTGLGGVAALGMGPTATHDVAAARGNGDLGRARDAARICLALAITSSIGFALLLAVIGWLYAPVWFEKVGATQRIHLIVVFAVLILTLEQIDSVFAGTLRGFERFDLSAKIEISAKFAQLAVTLLLAATTREILAVFVGSSIVAIVRTLAKLRASKNLLNLQTFDPKWDLPEMREAFDFGKWIWMQGLGGLLFAVADRTLIGSVLGPEKLGYYALALQLAQQVQSIPAAGAQVLLPAVALQRKKGERWSRLALHATLTVIGLSVLAAAGLAAVGPWFISIWLGSSVAQHVIPLVPLLAAAYALIALSAAPHHILIGRGKVRTVAIWSNIAGIATFIFSVWAIPLFGLIGAIGGRALYGLVNLALLFSLGRLICSSRYGLQSGRQNSG